MLKFSKITAVILIIFLLNTLFFSCYATPVTVTKENLSESLQELGSSDSIDKNYKVNVSDEVITITTTDGESYTLNYDLTDKPTFSIESLIQQGMSYADFKEQTDNLLSLPLLGYMAVANIQGAEFEDAIIYFVMSFLESSINDSKSNDNSYIIVDDTDLSDEVTTVTSESDQEIIYASEFGERVMEYVNATYKDKQTTTDATNGINSYELAIEKNDVTENSCKLVSSLTVNVDADFSKIKGISNQKEEAFLNEDITKDNADYAVTLKVGQKCRFESTEKITSYEISGSGCDYEKINENCAEITGTSVGKANGYIYVGETKKSFYITVEENSDNQALDTITLKIDNATGQQTTEVSKDGTTAKGTLPKTGVNNTIYIILASCLIFSAIFGIKLKKYKDIK